MSKSTLSSLAVSAAAILTSSAGVLGAQDLDAAIVTDPRAGTVTYEINVSGPPRGLATVFGGYGLLPSPLPLPNLGLLHLDPNLTIPILNVPIGPFGRGLVQLTVPMSLVDGDQHYFQALVNDGGNLALTGWSSTLFASNLAAKNLTTALMHNEKIQTYRGCFRGRPGAHVEIVHYRGGQIDIWQGIIPANGKLPVNFPYRHKQKHGDVIEIRCDGQPVKSWRR